MSIPARMTMTAGATGACAKLAATNAMVEIAASMYRIRTSWELGGHHTSSNAKTENWQSRLDVLQRLHRLRVGIANADHLSIRRCRGRAGYMNLCTHAYCARVTHNRLPRGSAGDVLALHEILHFADDCNGGRQFYQPTAESASNSHDETLYSAVRSKLSRYGACATYKSYLPSR